MSNSYFKFKQFTIFQNKSAMKVNTDSVLLGCYTDPTNCKKILDIGTGTGILAIQLSYKTDAKIEAIEIDLETSIEAMDNVKFNKKDNQINVINIDFNNYHPIDLFDLIISNPPYFEIGSPTRNEQRGKARYTENLTHEQLLKHANEILNENGILAICLPFATSEYFKTILHKYNFTLIKNIYVFPKINKKCYLELLFMKKGVFEINTIEYNIYIRDINNEYTDEYKKITKDLYLKF